MIKINVILNNNSWKKYLKNPINFFNKKIRLINNKNKIYRKKKLIFTLMLSGTSEIKRLNKQFRNKNKSTDILSFPFYEKKFLKKVILKNKELYLGDVIINLNKIKHKHNHEKFRNELNKIWIHGLVHLFGYTHKKEKNFISMSKMKKDI